MKGSDIESLGIIVKGVDGTLHTKFVPLVAGEEVISLLFKKKNGRTVTCPCVGEILLDSGFFVRSIYFVFDF